VQLVHPLKIDETPCDALNINHMRHRLTAFSPKAMHSARNVLVF